MEIKIDGRNIIMSGLKYYRDKSLTVTLSYVNHGSSIAYVVECNGEHLFFNSLCEALNDLKQTMYNDEMKLLLECLS